VARKPARETKSKLETYRRKRDFASTPEPSGGGAATNSDAPRFVVQRHRARRLHYDFRLEIDGVLVSWAVPKGLTLDPKARHLAVHVEDHPIEYEDFEGVIPHGDYGGGDVIVWDRGTWAPVGTTSPGEAIAAGELHLDLHGEKLAGRFVLVRSRRARSGKEQWILLHKHDDRAVSGWDPEAHPHSVKTGRTNDEVRADPEATWRSDRDVRRASDTVEVGDPRAWRAPDDGEQVALASLGKQGTWLLADRDLKVTNLDKVLIPAASSDEAPVTKRELIWYYAAIAPVMLPYLVGRPINLQRFPDGVERPGFWQKELPSHAPDWMHRWRNPDAGGGETQWYAVLDEPAALAWMANFGAVELHAWTSRIPAVRRPTWAMIDIDPGTSSTFEDVLVLARLYRTALEHLDVVGLPKVSGQRGIQIWVPIAPRYGFEQTRAWVETISRAIGATVPDLVSWKWSKSERGGRARLDFTQNAINKTLVAPYSVRPAPGAPVSVPIDWDELDDPMLAPDRWTVRTVFGRITTHGDPFAGLLGVEQDLPAL
jgi:bifunctional non-homologous end joining protein LigD